jgi:hypothetical protein
MITNIGGQQQQAEKEQVSNEERERQEQQQQAARKEDTVLKGRGSYARVVLDTSGETKVRKIFHEPLVQPDGGLAVDEQIIRELFFFSGYECAAAARRGEGRRNQVSKQIEDIIIPFYGSSGDAKTHQISLLLANGGLSIWHWIDRYKLNYRCRFDLMFRIFEGIFQFLVAFEHAGLWHGDLTVSNVLIDGNFQVHVIDFGNFTFNLELARPIYCANYYLPKEHLSDLFAVGNILYYYVTGDQCWLRTPTTPNELQTRYNKFRAVLDEAGVPEHVGNAWLWLLKQCMYQPSSGDDEAKTDAKSTSLPWLHFLSILGIPEKDLLKALVPFVDHICENLLWRPPLPPSFSFAAKPIRRTSSLKTLEPVLRQHSPVLVSANLISQIVSMLRKEIHEACDIGHILDKDEWMCLFVTQILAFTIEDYWPAMNTPTTRLPFVLPLHQIEAYAILTCALYNTNRHFIQTSSAQASRTLYDIVHRRLLTHNKCKNKMILRTYERAMQYLLYHNIVIYPKCFCLQHFPISSFLQNCILGYVGLS